MSNSFSNSMMSSTVSSESAPRSLLNSAVRGYFICIYTELVYDDILHSLFDVVHNGLIFLC